MTTVPGRAAADVVAEVVGGVLSNSLALLADAGHMFTDVAALALSLVAMRLAQRPPSPTKTYGYVRLEILAALIVFKPRPETRAPGQIAPALHLDSSLV